MINGHHHITHSSREFHVDTSVYRTYVLHNVTELARKEIYIQTLEGWAEKASFTFKKYVLQKEREKLVTTQFIKLWKLQQEARKEKITLTETNHI